MKRSIRFLATVVVLILAPDVHAMSVDSQKDFEIARTSAAQELKDLRADFNIVIRDRVASEESARLLATEVETLPGSEVAKPWVLQTSEPALDVVNIVSVSTLQSAQLIPADRLRNGGSRF